MHAQVTSNILVAVIGILTLGTLVGVVATFWSMGRSAYRKE